MNQTTQLNLTPGLDPETLKEAAADFFEQNTGYVLMMAVCYYSEDQLEEKEEVSSSIAVFPILQEAAVGIFGTDTLINFLELGINQIYDDNPGLEDYFVEHTPDPEFPQPVIQFFVCDPTGEVTQIYAEEDSEALQGD